jgi:hypothetical protein
LTNNYLLLASAFSVAAIDFNKAASASLKAFKFAASSLFNATSPLSNLDYKLSISPMTFFKES